MSTPPTPVRYSLLALLLVGIGAAISMQLLDPSMYDAAKNFLPLP